MTRRHRQRRRQYWIALWAILALLFNQTVAASHFCSMAAIAAPHASTLRQSGCSHGVAASNATASPGTMSGSPVTSHEVTACSVHCNHAADGDQHGKSPAVPMLATSGHDFPMAFLDTATAPGAGTGGDVPESRQRRLYEFCTLLI